MPAIFYIFCLAIVCTFFYEIVWIAMHARKAVLAGKRTVPVSKTHASPRKRVLVVGDSTSFGTGARESKNSLVGRLAEEYEDLEIVNASENAMGIKRLSTKLAEFQCQYFDVVMIHIGGVDTIALTTRHSISRYFDIIKKAVSSLGASTVILISMNNVGGAPIFRFPLNIFFDWRSRHLTKLFSKLSETHGFVHIPLYEDITCCPLVRERSRLFSDDKIHPNDDGYEVWYRIIRDRAHPYLSH